MKTTVKIQVAFPLNQLVGGINTFQAKGETVRQLLGNLDSQFPGLKERLINQQRKLNGSYLIFLNGEDIRSLQELETPLKNGDLVNILVVLSGG